MVAMPRISPQALLAGAADALELAAHGGAFVGVQRVPLAQALHATGQMYVEYWIPDRLVQPWPIVMIHGGGGQGLDFLVTPDGRPSALCAGRCECG